MFTNSSQKHARAGMTLAEILVATAVSSIILLAIGAFVIYSGRNMAGIYNYVDMEYTTRHAEQVMTREIRQAARLKECGTNKVVLVDYDGTDLVYEYSPTTKTLVRQKGEHQEVLLTQCNALEFKLYRQTPVAGSYELVPRTKVADGKVIGVNWACSRTVMGTANNELMREVLIVVRKG
jgi:prepilin-type N-terminal cleavage/methylation domain-containing protein